MPKSSSRLTINIIQIATFQLRVTYDYLDENDIVTTSMNFDHYINKFKRNQKLDRSSLSLDPLFPPPIEIDMPVDYSGKQRKRV